MLQHHPTPPTGPVQESPSLATLDQVSAQLTGAYRDLEVQVSELQLQLHSARQDQAQQLAEREALAERLQTLLAALPTAVVVLNTEQVVVECNSCAVELLEVPLLGQSWQQVLARAVAGDDHQRQELNLRSGVVVTQSRRALDEGFQVVALNDITEQRRLGELLARRERLATMGEVSARLAHQIRTPLASAMLYISHISQLREDPSRLSVVVENLRERLRHMEQSINDMLTFAGGSKHPDEIIDLNDLLQQLHSLVDQQLSAAGHRLILTNNVQAPKLRGQRAALLGALTNLVTNAMQACGSGGRLELEMTVDHGWATITLRDDGPGIDEVLSVRLFEPFFTTRSDGTGLGLAVVRSVAISHGGEVSCTNSEGGGAVFSLRLPLQDSGDLDAVDLNVVELEAPDKNATAGA